MWCFFWVGRPTWTTAAICLQRVVLVTNIFILSMLLKSSISWNCNAFNQGRIMPYEHCLMSIVQKQPHWKNTKFTKPSLTPHAQFQFMKAKHKNKHRSSLQARIHSQNMKSSPNTQNSNNRNAQSKIIVWVNLHKFILCTWCTGGILKVNFVHLILSCNSWVNLNWLNTEALSGS